MNERQKGIIQQTLAEQPLPPERPDEIRWDLMHAPHEHE